MQLSVRLKSVADMVSHGSRVADIGCDHAYISIYLIKSESALKVIAMDVKKGPLERAKENIRKYGLEDQIETRLSDGAKQLLPGEADTLLIAGMGGALTVKILSESAEVTASCKEIILQPQSEIWLVRQHLRRIGFFIKKEEMIFEDGKYYVIIKARNGGNEETKSDIQELSDRFGQYLLDAKNLVLKEYLKNDQGVVLQLLVELKASESEKAEKRIEELKKDLYYIEEGLKYYEM